MLPSPSSPLFPSLVIAGHVFTLLLVWHWRERLKRRADERDRVQKKTFTKWVNKHLMKAHRSIDDLYEDLRDGHNLISLLEVLSGESLPREKGRMRFHKLQNVGIALEYLKHRQVRLVNIRNDDIADGNPKLTLGLIWTIILHFQISDIQVTGQSDDMTAKEKLLLWSQRMVEGYPDLRCDNFTSSWRDGRLFNAVIHRHRPVLIDMNKVYRQKNQENLEQAFSIAERELGVTRLLDPEDVDVPHPDEKSIITYVSSLYDALPRVPNVEAGIRANEIEMRWQEYYEMVTLLIQWIRHHITIFEERKFPGTYEEMEVLWRQFLKFKESDLPTRETEKQHSKTLFKNLEGAVQEGHLKVPAGYHPIDVEKEWGKLHVSILERERVLRSEFERLERFQRIILRIQQESNTCEEQIKQSDTLLKSDIRLLNAGKPPQNVAVLEHDLDKSDSLIRSLFNDVQTLKDGRHPQAEQMYRRVFRLHEFLVATRTEYSLRFKSGVQQPIAQTVAPVSKHSPSKASVAVDGVTLKYIQDLLEWIEENQRRLDAAEWGVDLPTVQTQLGVHRGLHQSIEDFRVKIERARADEAQLSPTNQTAYRDYLGKLDLQYAKLLNSSKSRLRNLESLNNFVSMATKELMWLNDKEEEEVNYDWSERNTNMAAKKDNYSALMKELELKEKKVNSIQNTGDKLLRDGHPAKQTIEAFMAALQTQWSWILQLCCCIEAHLKENTAYFQYFSDVNDAENFLKKLQDSIKRKYVCDRSITVTRLEDLLQDSIEEKEQLCDYKSHLNGLSKRAKTIVQLKPRNPAHPLKANLLVQAVCDYKQMEITVSKGDEYILLNNSQPKKWKVVSVSGNEALVPSVCFTVPPSNKEALDATNRLESTHHTLVTMWHQLHTDMQSLLPWLYLHRDMQQVRSWTLLTFRSLTPEDYKQILLNLERHYQDFMRQSQDSQMFGADDRIQLEREYKLTTQHYEKLLQNLERGEQDEASCRQYVTQLKDIRLQLESCEKRTIHKIRQPLDKDPLGECKQRLNEQQKIHLELEGIQKNLNTVTEKTEKVLAMPEQLSSAPTLRSELDLTTEKMDRVYSLSAIYLDKLKTIDVVIRSTQEAEDLVKKYETQLREVNNVPADAKSLESYKKQLKGMRVEVGNNQQIFDNLESELSKAKVVNERMIRSHSERDVDLDRYRECVQQLLEHWQGIQGQIDTRSRELDQLGRHLTYYRDAHDWLIQWIRETKERQEKMQAVAIRGSSSLKQQLQQEQKVLQEVMKNREKVDECEKFAKQYIDAIKDYELQLVTYKAQVAPLASPVKKQKVTSASDSIIQEYVDLRTRYIELMTLSSQYIKFISINLQRLETEEMEAGQKKEIAETTQILQQTFISEKELLLKKEKMVEEEKERLERLYEDELKKSQSLKDEQSDQMKKLEDEKHRLQASMEEALRKQKEAEDLVHDKQKELQEMEEKRQQKEKQLAEENRILREQLEAQKKIKEMAPIQQVTVTPVKAISNGRDMVDSAAESEDTKLTFSGLRQPVTAGRLQQAGILSRKQLDKLKKGSVTVQELSQKENLKTYLQGKSCIAGLILEPRNEKLSIYQAMKQGILKPTTATSLLEAQAASGFIIDPIKNKKLPVNEAIKEAVVGPELQEKLLSAERAVTGYRDPYTGNTISLFEAMKKDLISPNHAIRLLQAQMATGGIIDPLNSHRLPLEQGYKQGIIDEKMSKTLPSDTDETKGYFDPNTQEYLTYFQLMDRCQVDPETGLCLLPLTDEAVTHMEGYTTEQTRDIFSTATVSVPSGKYSGKTVTIWELIHSGYFTEEQRRDLIRQYRSGKVTIESIIKYIITIIGESEAKKQLLFDGLRDKVPASELLESKIIDKKTFDGLQKGKATPEDVGKLDSVKRYLQGSDSIAGVFIEPTKTKMSFYEAMKKNMLSPSTAEALLEAQAGSGFIVDPVKNRTLTVDEAVKEGLVGPELHEKLLSAEKAVTGYTDPYTGRKISLFEAITKDLVSKGNGIRLLEAQIATGGIIDPVHSHRLPVDVAYQRGMFDQEMNKILSAAADDTKGFLDPNTDEDLTYQQLKERCVTDPETGLYLIPIKDSQIPQVVESMVHSEVETREVFENTTVELPEGTLGGKSMSVWEILNSELLTEKERLRLTRDYRSGKITRERLVVVIIEIIQQVEIRRGYEMITFNTFRGKITADQLYSSKIIDMETLNMLKDKRLTVQQVCEMESVRKYLFGTGAISGIYKCAGKEVLTLYHAMKKGLVKPEITDALLEAQAATGFMLDPVKNKRLSVDEAVREGLVGPELHDRLLSAERAVTGYRDPYTGKTISLFQAMKKGLIAKEYVLRLLDAQLVTGGIIDPEYSYHLPLETAYQRGYLDRETYSLLTDPTEGPQGFHDPSTEEPMSYTQLLKRCRVDENSGQRLLTLTDRKRLVFKGLRKQITMEQLVASDIITSSDAAQLLEGEITVEQVSDSIKKYLEGTSCISGVFVEATKERLTIYQAMKKGMIRPGTAFELLEAQAATGYMIDPIKNLKLTVSDAVKMGVVGPEFKDKLLSAERAVTGYRDPYSGELLSLFQAMQKSLILKDHGIRLLESQIATGGIIDPEYSHRLPVEVAYKRGLFDEEMNKILSDPGDDTKGFFDPNTEENLTYLQLKERCVVDSDTGLCLLILKDKKRERKTSSKSSVRKRRVVIVDPETGKEMSVYEAYRKGLIDHQTYTELSEQECEWEEVTISSSDGVVKSVITDKRSGRQYDIDDALSKGLIDQGSLDLYRSGALSITEFADMLSGNMSGFRSRTSSVGSSSSYTSQQASPMRSHMVTWNDPVEETCPVAGILDTDTLEKVSITEAMHRNLVDNISGQRLLEAQACTGGIIDPTTGEKYSVTDAVAHSLVDKIMVDRINLAQKAFNGFEDPRTKTKMSAAQALKKGWLYYEAGQRFLEVQYLTGGLIEPDVTGRVSLDEALQKGTIDARTAQKLRDVGAHTKYITCPKTKLKISYKDAMDRSMIEEGTGLRLLEASSQSTKGFYSPYNVSGAGSSAGSRSGSRTGSRTGSRRGSFDASGSGYSMSFSSSSYTSSSYGRRLASTVPGGREMVTMSMSSRPLPNPDESSVFTQTQLLQVSMM